jgi:hypothetical protein
MVCLPCRSNSSQNCYRRALGRGPAGPLVPALAEHEVRLAYELRRPDERELSAGVRHAVSPVLAAVVD